MNLSNLYLQLARKVVSESLHLKKGESLTVETWNNGLPFARLIVAEARRVGAAAITLFEDESVYLDSVKNTPKDVLGQMGKHEYALLSGTDAYVFIPGPLISMYSPRLTREEYVNSTRYNLAWYEAAEKAGLRGVRLVFGYIGKDFAKLLGKSVDTVVVHLLRASLVDYRALGKVGMSVSQHLADGEHATLKSNGSKLDLVLTGDLTVEDGVVDEKDVSERDNIAYIPPGVVSKKVDPSSASGEIRISSSVTRLGLVADAVLEFENGKLVRWRSKGSKEKLDKLLEALPEEKRTLTSLTVGMNPVLKYGYGHDRFVYGAVGITGFGFTGISRRATLSTGKTIVDKGKIASSS